MPWFRSTLLKGPAISANSNSFSKVEQAETFIASITLSKTISYLINWHLFTIFRRRLFGTQILIGLKSAIPLTQYYQAYIKRRGLLSPASRWPTDSSIEFQPGTCGKKTMPIKNTATYKGIGGLLVAIAFWTFPVRAHAYIDPGLLGSLYQIIYIFIFGVLASWVLRPFRFISMKFKELKSRFTRKNPESPEA